MKRILLMAGALMLTLQLFAGAASASYQEEDDIYVNINTPVGLPALPTGQLTFDVQEKLHSSLFRVSGLSVNHFYIWLNVNGQSVAAVDPAKAMF